MSKYFLAFNHIGRTHFIFDCYPFPIHNTLLTPQSDTPIAWGRFLLALIGEQLPSSVAGVAWVGTRISVWHKDGVQATMLETILRGLARSRLRLVQ